MRERQQIERGVKRGLRALRGRAWQVVGVAAVAAAALAAVYGESWALRGAPDSSPAYAVGQTADIRPALDGLLAALTRMQSEDGR